MLKDRDARSRGHIPSLYLPKNKSKRELKELKKTTFDFICFNNEIKLIIELLYEFQFRSYLYVCQLSNDTQNRQSEQPINFICPRV